MSKLGRKPKPLYMFNLELKLLKVFKGSAEAGKFLGRSTVSIDTAIFRKSVIDRRFYLSRDRNFKKPHKGKGTNPLDVDIFNPKFLKEPK